MCKLCRFKWVTSMVGLIGSPRISPTILFQVPIHRLSYGPVERFQDTRFVSFLTSEF
jgi:hypothetical protein